MTLAELRDALLCATQKTGINNDAQIVLPDGVILDSLWISPGGNLVMLDNKANDPAVPSTSWIKLV